MKTLITLIMVVVMCYWVGKYAENKRLNKRNYIIISFLLSPFIGAIAVWIIDRYNYKKYDLKWRA